MSLSAFARRYLRNRCCFLFLWLLRCFSSPGSLPQPMHSATDDPKGPGFPIQRSTDQSLFASSLWLIAGYNVFHRLSMPRHPPYALSSFITPTCNRLTPTWVRVTRWNDISNDPVEAQLHTPGGMCSAAGVTGQAPQNACTRCYYNSATPKTSIHLSKNAVDLPRLVDVSRCCGPGCVALHAARLVAGREV